jgi:hypothetical protein
MLIYLILFNFYLYLMLLYKNNYINLTNNIMEIYYFINYFIKLLELMILNIGMILVLGFRNLDNYMIMYLFMYC